jgi:hypothetical protein
VESSFDDNSAFDFSNISRNHYFKTFGIENFEKEVNKQLNTIIQRNKKQLQAEMSGRILQQSGPFDLEKKQIQNQIKNYQMAYDSASVELEKEILGKQSGLTSGKVGYGTNAKRKAELKEQKRADLENYQKQMQPRLQYLDTEISKVYSNLETERKSTEGIEDKFNGFAARLQALDELGKIRQSLFWQVYYGIIYLFGNFAGFD